MRVSKREAKRIIKGANYKLKLWLLVLCAAVAVLLRCACVFVCVSARFCLLCFLLNAVVVNARFIDEYRIKLSRAESRVIAFTCCCCCCVQHFVHYARCTVLVRNAYRSNVNKIETKLIIVTHSLAHSSNFSFWLHLEERKRKNEISLFRLIAVFQWLKCSS